MLVLRLYEEVLPKELQVRLKLISKQAQNRTPSSIYVTLIQMHKSSFSESGLRNKNKQRKRLNLHLGKAHFYSFCCKVKTFIHNFVHNYKVLSDIIDKSELFTYSYFLTTYLQYKMLFLYIVNFLGLFQKTKSFYVHSQMECKHFKAQFL